MPSSGLSRLLAWGAGGQGAWSMRGCQMAPLFWKPVLEPVGGGLGGNGKRKASFFYSKSFKLSYNPDRDWSPLAQHCPLPQPLVLCGSGRLLVARP